MQKQTNNIFNKQKFALVINNITQQTTNKLKKICHQHGANLLLIQCPPTEENPKIKVDYLLAEENIDASQLRLLLPPTIIYKEALDVKYIESCLQAKRMLRTRKFRLKGSSDSEGQELENSQPRKMRKTEFTALSDEPEKVDLVSGKKGQKHNNKFIIEELNKLYKVYANSGDKGRKIAYSRAIAAIKALEQDLETEEDVDKITKEKHRHIGDKISAKIKELLKTGHIRKLQELKKSDRNVGLEELTRVWGIGSAKAKELYDIGITTIDELRIAHQKNPNILTKNQKIGLKYLEDFEIRIPRKKVSKLLDVVRETLFELVGRNDLHEIQACGSYRREKPDCGDIDVFITRKDGTYEKDLLKKLIETLTAKKFLTDHLTTPRQSSGHTCQSYMGVCHLNDDIHHRIDIKYYPTQEFAFAVLYFTGSDNFNRKMRLWAMEHGYHLSDHGIYKADKVGTKSNPSGPPIKCKTEKQIFDLLKLEYKHPKDRDI